MTVSSYLYWREYRDNSTAAQCIPAARMAPSPKSRYDSNQLENAFANTALQHCKRTDGSIQGMCRNIRPLFNFEPPATQQEIEAAATQFVRKVSGGCHAAQVNRAACERASAEIAALVSELLASLVTQAEPRNRDVEAARARARSKRRFAGA
jgi:hypothetical protein